MENLSLREAVKAFNVSRPTLTKALNSGKLSGTKNDKGQWKISPSELARVYHPRASEEDTDGKGEHVSLTTVHIELEKIKSELELAKHRAEAAEKLAQERAERIDDLRRLLPAPKPQATSWLWLKKITGIK